MTTDPVTFTATSAWKLTLPCTRDEAQALAGDLPQLAAIDPPPVLMTSEADPDRPEDWRLDAYFEVEPDAAIVAMIRSLAPSARRRKPRIERLADDDWVALSQAGLDPVAAGRFLVRTPQHRGPVPPDIIAFEIEAGRAFGTGHHETTAGCLLLLDRLRRRGRHFAHVADIGTGTGLLAFAARALWPTARIVASDIDPVAIDVTAGNAAINRVPLGIGPGRIELVTAPGLDHRRIERRAPYDLLIANILAGPLIDLAPAFGAATQPGGVLILAGLLDRQADAVAAAGRRAGFRLAGRIDQGDWPVLHMVKRAI